jgi:hypothetical protein
VTTTNTPDPASAVVDLDALGVRASVGEACECAAAVPTAMLRAAVAELRAHREREEANSTWVLVAERMPEPDIPVWICLLRTCNVIPAFYRGEFDVGEGAYPTSCVTHWMPRFVQLRPAPPQRARADGGDVSHTDEAKAKTVKVVQAASSPMNRNQWLCELSCGHEIWEAAVRRPSAVVCRLCVLVGMKADGRLP